MVHHITTATSVDVASGDAFDGTGPDSLIVDAGAFLISEASGVLSGSGATLMGSWTVTINGVVGTFTDLHIQSHGIGFFGTDSATLTIGKSGNVFSNDIGLASNEQITIKNLGVISGGDDSIFSSAATHLTNAGSLRGFVVLSGSDDVFNDFVKVGKTIKSGTVDHTILLGDGNDHFNGGANAETVQDGDGADTIKLGGGNDTYSAVFNFLGDGIDVIDGGKGAADLYDASTVTSVDLIINLDSVTHTDVLTGAPNTAAVKNSIFFYSPETITGFENASGGNGNDSIFGTAAANVLTGNNGFDGLFGFGGNDRLLGGAGADNIFGGKGSDILSGGADPDTFNFLSLSDSTVAKSGRDTITDFGPNFDKIDLSVIDAVKGGGDDAFTFIGVSNFHHVAGELRESFSGADTIVSGDVNGDGNADFAITLENRPLLHDTDFVL
jgi:serralysin